MALELDGKFDYLTSRCATRQSFGTWALKLFIFLLLKIRGVSLNSPPICFLFTPKNFLRGSPLIFYNFIKEQIRDPNFFRKIARNSADAYLKSPAAVKTFRAPNLAYIAENGNVANMLARPTEYSSWDFSSGVYGR